MYALNGHHKSQKNGKNTKQSSLNSSWADIYSGCELDVWNDYFAPGFVHACLINKNTKNSTKWTPQMLIFELRTDLDM